MPGKILIVDDEPSTCRALEKFFNSKGYEVSIANGGEEALSKLDSEGPLVMLLDIRMPEMDGLEVLARVNKKYPSLGVIMITAVTDLGVAQKASDLGADDFLTKPIDLEHLEKTVWGKIVALTAQ